MIRVSLVEDNQNDVFFVRKSLEKQLPNCEIHHFPSFALFKKEWNRDQSDIVLTDHNLGDAYSFDVIEFVRNQDSDFPLIVLSGSLLNHEIVRFVMDYKVNEIVLKSDLSTLAASITAQIETYNAKHLLHEQKEEVRKLSLVAKHTHNGVVIMDHDSKISWVNHAYSNITGYTLEESVGKMPSELISGSNTSYQVIEDIRRHIEKKEAFTKEFIAYKKNGEEYWIKLDFTPIIEQGKFVGFVAIQEDITERVHNFKRIEESEDRLDVAIHGADLGVWDLDMETRCILVNDFWRGMLGYETGELSPSLDSFIEILHPDDFAAIADVLDQLNAGKNEFDLDVRLKHKNGEYRVIRDRGRVMKRNADGTVRRIIGTHLDITSEKNLEQELNRSLSEKTILLQEIHHRVKNNLAIIIGLLHLQAYSVENDEMSEFYNQMSKRIKSIAHVHEMLYQTDSLSSINLNKYVQKIFNTAVAVNSSTSIPKALVYVDEGFDININQGIPLGLLLNELITNSLKHAFAHQENPVISFSVLHLDSSIQCIYKDNGSGCNVKNCSTGNSFGFTLINTLLEQLEAESTVKTEHGFELSFTFQMKHKGSHSMIDTD